jgi:hypothetical protein
MNTILDIEPKDQCLATADFATAAEVAPALPTPSQDATREENPNSGVRSSDKQLAGLFLPDVDKELRTRWDTVQKSFVDDPSQAVRQADELVGQVMKDLAEAFSNERAKLENQVDQTDKVSTENLRVVLRRYRSFFERLLSV